MNDSHGAQDDFEPDRDSRTLCYSAADECSWIAAAAVMAAKTCFHCSDSAVVSSGL